MSEREPSARGPEAAFERLRDRPTPELDSRRLWRRIEARLLPRSVSLWQRLAGPNPGPVLRFARLAALLAVVALAVWLALPERPTATDGFVLLAPAELGGTAADPADPAGGVVLDVRLVRGYDGPPPPDVRAARALGVGGADALSDVRGRIEALLPHAGFGIVGAWQGSIADGAALDVELSDVYRLVARSAAGRNGEQVRLDGIELAGAGAEPVSGDLTLEPGRLYFLGLAAPAADARDLVLLIRARLAAPER
jgi:hypothetical protein